ncbi:MAG: ABC transporter permease [Oscillospiraceae bacterium]|jgi:oligopeptide transport system permease protein|nr:ABC transporter permease [Oscillospiraceae bacterium]
MDGKKHPFPSFHLNIDPADFEPADIAERESLAVMRPSAGFWGEGMRRLRRNKIAMVSLAVIAVFIVGAFVVPFFYPYSYDKMDKESGNLRPLQHSDAEKARMENGERVFPHFMGTDQLGRDTMIRLLMGSRISLLVGIIASAIILLIGSVYGAVAGYFGGRADIVMMRIVDLIYSVPDILIIIILQVTLKEPLKKLAANVPGFAWIEKVGVSLICIFIVFSLLYWVGMARIVRSQILALKQQDFVVAARALGASSGRIIRRHLLTNCIGTLTVTTTLQIPASIFTESFLSFLGLGVAAPMTSLGSMASDALSGIWSYPHRLISAAVMISLIILSFNLLGDGLRDAFDPKLKHDSVKG